MDRQIPNDGGAPQEDAATKARRRPLMLTKGEKFRVGVAVVSVVFMTLEWELADRLSFLWLIFLLGVLFLLPLALIWELFVLVFRNARKQALIRLSVMVSCAVVVVCVPFTDYWLEWDFESKKSEREEIVRKVVDGAIKPNVSYNERLITLPDDVSILSRGGNQILVEEHDGKKYVFFFTYRGILDSYAGYIHVPDGGDPMRYSDMSDGITQVVHKTGNWFFISHN